jgi:hypothetical protein
LTLEREMQRAALILLSLGLCAGAQAQNATGSDPPTAKPRALTVAPDSPEKIPDAKPGNNARAAGMPANICLELIAFLETKAAASQPPTDQSKAVESGGKTTPPKTGTAGPGQTAPPMDQSQQRSGLSAPTPQDDSTTGNSQVTMEKAKALANSNDLRGCQRATQEMRLAGEALPPPLLALAALRGDLLKNMASADTPPENEHPKNGQGPAAQAPFVRP